MMAARIKVSRHSMALTQEQFASLLGVSVRAVQKWEAGETEPRMPQLATLVQRTGRTATWFLTGDEALA